MSHPCTRANICSFMSFMLQKKKYEEILAKTLQVSHPDGNLEVQRKTGNSPRR